MFLKEVELLLFGAGVLDQLSECLEPVALVCMRELAGALDHVTRMFVDHGQ